MASFGERFGRMVKLRRGIEGLTQQQLAVRAFGNESRKTRISELETGVVAKPHQSTVDALATALAITPEQVEACYRPAVLELPPGLQEEIGLADGLLENLAMRFGHDNPDAGRGALHHFLKEKADEYKEIKARLDALAVVEQHLSNRLAAAAAAIERGDFDAGDEILSSAEEIQQTEHTLAQVRRQADIRATRGDAALLKSDAEAAYSHFVAAVAFFDTFNPLEGAERRFTYYLRMYQHGLRFGGAGLSHAVRMAQLNLKLYAAHDELWDWARTQNNLGVFLNFLGQRTVGDAGTRLLARAVKACKAALQVRTEAEHPFDWAVTQNNYANALKSKGERTPGKEGTYLLAQAVQAFEAALRVLTEAEHPLEWAKTQTNLALALQRRGERMAGEEGIQLLARAVAACEAALRVRTEAEHPHAWAMTQHNLADALRAQGERMTGEEENRLLGRVVDAFGAALRVFTEAEHPLAWATTQKNLAVALRVQGERTAGEAGGRLLARAVGACVAALRIYTEAEHPLAWTETMEVVALTHEAIAAKRSLRRN